MGDRAVICNKEKDVGVYMHWHGYREFVESILAYCDAKNYRSPDYDSEYGWARLCQVLGNTMGGTLSLGVGFYPKMDRDNWDNGTYVIEDWNIKERLYQRYEDEKMRESIFDNLKFINDKQPEEEKLEEEELEKFAELWEEKHIDRLNEERRPLAELRVQAKEEALAKEKQRQEQEREQVEEKGDVDIGRE